MQSEDGTMTDARKKAIEAAANEISEDVSEDLSSMIVAEHAIAAFEASMLKDGQKMMPFKPTNGMVFAAANVAGVDADTMADALCKAWQHAPLPDEDRD